MIGLSACRMNTDELTVDGVNVCGLTTRVS